MKLLNGIPGYAILLLAFGISMSAKAQDFRAQDAIFLRSKGHWPIPLKRYKKILIPKFDPTRSIEPPTPSITFYTFGPVDIVYACFDGTVQACMNIGEETAVMIRCGHHFLVYFDLSTSQVKKGDIIRVGQAIGVIMSDSTGGELEVRLTDEKVNYLDPANWFDWKGQPPFKRPDHSPNQLSPVGSKPSF